MDEQARNGGEGDALKTPENPNKSHECQVTPGGLTRLHTISLGAGVQSSTMALMAAKGEITPLPNAAIFADTQAEPASVYRWLDWLERQLPFPVYRVTNGNIEEDTLRIRERRDKMGFWCPGGIPHYTINADGSKGHGLRQCTHDFKLTPIARQQRVLMREHGVKKVVVWIGISADEAHRMKSSRVRYAEHRWPLVDLGMKRKDCLQWMEKNGFPKPPRSACVFCPYHSDDEWQRLKEDEPQEFARAVAFERKYQAAKLQTVRLKGFVPFLHSKRIPLDQVDFSKPGREASHFGNECEGMCGV